MSWLDKYRDGGPGPKRTDLRSLISNSDNRQSSTRVVTPTLKKTPTKAEEDALELKRRKDAITASDKARKQHGELSREGFANAAAGEKLRLFPDDPDSFIDDYINPAHMIGAMADNLGHAWFGDGSAMEKALSIAMPLGVGALAGVGTTNAAQFANNVVNPLVGTGDLIKSGVSKAVDYVKYKTPFYEFIKPSTIEGIHAKNFKNEVGERISTDGGYNLGVYDLKRFKDYVAKIEPTKKLATDMGMHDYGQYNFVSAMKGVDDPTIAKVQNQFTSLLDPNYRTLIMNKIEGKALSELTPRDMRRIPKESFEDLYSKIKNLRDNNLGVDFHGQNINYNPTTQKFGVYDINPGIPSTNSYNSHWNKDILGGMSKEVFGTELSGMNIKSALTHKLKQNYWINQNKILNAATRAGYYVDPKKEDILLGASNAFRDKIKETLRDLPHEKEGGQWLSKYRDGGPKKPGQVVSRQESTRVVPVLRTHPDAFPDKMTADYYNRVAALSGNEDGYRELRRFTGNPKINVVPDTRKTSAGRASFNYLTNTATVGDFNPKDMSIQVSYDDLMNELAHAKQLKEQGYLKILGRHISEWPQIVTKGYNSLYDTPGTLENEAHYVVQPGIENRNFEAEPQPGVKERFKVKQKYPDGGEKPRPYKVKNFFSSYMESPIYQERLSNFNDNNITQRATPESVKSVRIYHAPGVGSQTMNPYYMQAAPITIDPMDLEKKTFDNWGAPYKGNTFNYEEVLAHELSHSSRKLSGKEIMRISDLNRHEVENEVRQGFDNLGKIDKNKLTKAAKLIQMNPYEYYMHFENLDYKYRDSKLYGHDLNPSENKADLDALRYQMYKYNIYDTRKGPVDQDTIIKAMEHPKIKNSISTKRLLMNFGYEDLVKMNNEIAAVNKPSGIPIAKTGGQWLNKYL